MNIERSIIAACLKNPQYVARVHRAKIQAKHFKDPTNRDLFTLILRAVDHQAYTTDAVLEFIKQDNFDQVKKPIYLVTLQKLATESSDTFDMSIGLLERERKKIELVSEISKTLTLIEQGKELEDAISSHHAAIASLAKSSQRLLVEDHYSTIKQREAERAKEEEYGVRMQMVDNFSCLQKYFHRGLTPGTITTIEGPTGFGKSVAMANFVYLSTLPQNKLNCLYAYSENMRADALARLDSVILDIDYDLIRGGAVSDKDVDFMENVGKFGYGKLLTTRAPFEEFDVDDLRVLLDDKEEEGIPVHVLFLDSAAHMRPKRSGENFWLTAYNIFKDLKALAEERNLIIVTTRQQKASEVNKKDVDAYGGTDGAKISQIVDNIMSALYHPKEDNLSGVRKIVVTKSRDGGQLDQEALRFKQTRSLRWILEENWIEPEGVKAKDLLVKYKIIQADKEE